MAKHKIELLLKGEFTGIDISLEGIQIDPREINDHDYYKLFSEFEIRNPLDIHARFDGFIGMKWSVLIKVDDKVIYTREGVFDYKGFVTFTDTKDI
jgi:hypothetical protein